ncbi:apelin receptor 2 [Stigmatopora nigra]
MESNTSDLDHLTSPSPFLQCDYTDWSPSFSIIPSIYLLAFAVGCLGNALVLWAYLDRTPKRSRRSHLLKFCSPPCPGEEEKAELERNSSSSSSSSSPPTNRPRSLTHSLIASLALADLSFLVTLPLWAAYTALGYHWPFGETLCRLSSFLTALNMYASVFSLSVLSIERHRVLTGPPRRPCPASSRVLAALWSLSGILALPGFLLRSTRDPEWPDPSGSVACRMDYSALIGDQPDEEAREVAQMRWAAVLSLKSTLLGFLFPLAVLLACYCSLARLLGRHFGRGPRPDRPRQRRLLRVIVTLVLAFFLCWLPLHVNKTLSLLLELGFLPYSCVLDQILLAVHPYATCVAYLNSCLNPLLYAACDRSFRRKCGRMLRSTCGERKKKEVGEMIKAVDERSDSSGKTREADAGVEG